MALKIDREISYIHFQCTKMKTFFLNLKKNKHLFHETPNYTKHYMKLKIFKVLHFYWKWGLRYTPLVGMKQAPIIGPIRQKLRIFESHADKGEPGFN